MTFPDPHTLAAAIHRLADRIHAEVPDDLDKGRDWRRGIAAGSSGTRAVGSHSDPTGSTATDHIWAEDQTADPDYPKPRKDPAADLFKKLTHQMTRMESARLAFNEVLDRFIAVSTERKVANDLIKANGLEGYCEVCVKAQVPTPLHSGQGDDRLRRVVTGERFQGEPLVPRMCNPCRVSWSRRPYSDAMLGLYQEWDVWLVDRVHHLRRGAAA